MLCLSATQQYKEKQKALNNKIIIIINECKQSVSFSIWLSGTIFYSEWKKITCDEKVTFNMFFARDKIWFDGCIDVISENEFESDFVFFYSLCNLKKRSIFYKTKYSYHKYYFVISNFMQFILIV